MDVFVVGIGGNKEAALDELKDILWREVWKECVELEGVRFKLRADGMWEAWLEGLPGVERK